MLPRSDNRVTIHERFLIRSIDRLDARTLTQGQVKEQVIRDELKRDVCTQWLLRGRAHVGGAPGRPGQSRS